jgi:hypothetical protein
MMDGLGLDSFNFQAPPQLQLVHFPFLDLKHPSQGFCPSGCDCRFGRVSCGPGLVHRTLPGGLHPVVLGAIDKGLKIGLIGELGGGLIVRAGVGIYRSKSGVKMLCTLAKTTKRSESGLS